MIKMNVTTGNLLDAIMAFEQGSLDEESTISLFQHLVDTGMAWKLQGFYGRTAMDLIEAGAVLPAPPAGPSYNPSTELADEARADIERDENSGK
jgi:hypothetical protein